MLPAILLLLSERPGYGYGLVPRLRGFRLGHVDRPAVYRALSQLERDQLVESSSQHRTAGQSRRVYGITPLGERVLRAWMGVVEEEHDCLGEVLRRYQATGTTESVLAESGRRLVDCAGLRLVAGRAVLQPGRAGAGWISLSSRPPGRRISGLRPSPRGHSPRAADARERRDGSGWCRIDRWY